MRQADAAERQIALTWPAMPEPADLVTWSVEHRKGNTYALRNAGTATATAVTVDEGRVTSLHRLLPKQATIAPGSSEEFLLIGAFGAPIPREVWVSWDGADRPVAVAVPSKSGS